MAGFCRHPVDPPQVFDFSKVDSDAKLHSPVELTGNVNMI